MKTNSYQLAVFSINNRKNKTDPNPDYQRNPVWQIEKKQLLIDSILRGYDIPKIYLRTLEKGNVFDHQVVDGQQRLRAIWDFCENQFPLGNESVDFDALPNLDGKFFCDLTKDQQDIILSFNLTIADISDAGEEEIRELFLRLQEGESLKPPEKRNAMIGNMRNFVQEISQLPIFAKTTQKNDRFQHADYAAHIVAIELAGGPTDVKAADLKRIYETNQNFNEAGPEAKKIKKVLNFLDKAFPEVCPDLKIKWGFVDLYLLVSRCLDVYDISARQTDFNKFYISFEYSRNAAADPSELITSGSSPSHKDLYDYIQAFQREGATRGNLEQRSAIYLRKFLEDFPDLVAKYPIRAFSEAERIVIWRRSYMKCQKCGCDLKALSEMHADHISPHSKGGLTSIDNGQALCAPCNLSKSNNS